MQRYSLLYSLYSDKEFTYAQAQYALKPSALVSLILSHLNKHGWLEIRLDPGDSRRRIYKLKHPESAVKGMAESFGLPEAPGISQGSQAGGGS